MLFYYLLCSLYLSSLISSFPTSNALKKVVTTNSAIQLDTKSIKALVGKSMSAKFQPLKAASIAKPLKKGGTAKASSTSFKAFRVPGQPVVAYQHTNGTFSNTAYSKAMKVLAERSRYINSTGKVLSKRQSSSSSDSNSDNVILITSSTDITYPTALVEEFEFGTPGQ